MTVETFVEELAKKAFDLEELRKRRLLNEGDFMLHKGFYATKKTGIVINSSFILVDLINSYDCSSLDIRNLRFLAKPIIRGEYISFGKLEAEEFAIHRKNKYIALLEHETDYTTEWMLCAKDETAFLESVLAGAEYWALFIAKIDVPDEELNKEEIVKLNEDYIEKCMEIAGGVDYKDFFSYWLQYLPD